MNAFMETATSAARAAATYSWTHRTTTIGHDMDQHDDDHADRDGRHRHDERPRVRRAVSPPPARRRQLRHDAAVQAAWLAGLR